MKKQWISTFLGLMSCFQLNANVIIDVYGTNEELAKRILKKYATQISRTEEAMFEKSTKKQENSKSYQKLKQAYTSLKDSIKKEYGFLYVDFQTIFYGVDKNLYTTIEVVSSDQPGRLRFMEAPAAQMKGLSQNTVANTVHKKDIIQSMEDYSQQIRTDFMNGKQPSASCPVYHCTMGFEDPKYKPYLSLFNQGAIKQKQLILNTLKNDPDEARREAAMFLMGHFKDPQEIIRILNLYVQDKSSLIRNNAMRIIAMTMEKAKIYDVALSPIFPLLDAPNITDRNKALSILLSAMHAPANHKIILQNCGDNLLKILALKQLNNSDMSYLILKQLSGKDFPQQDLAAWKNWLKEARAKLA